LICDYFVIRHKNLSTQDLYQRGGLYEYSRGVNWQAIVALAAGAGVAFVGLFFPALRVLYNYAWFVGFAVSFFAYLVLTPKPAPVPQLAD
jgi:NCS1 family nucleobase:cation symporter-1